MYISGTRLDRLSGLRDVLDDVTFLPLRKAYNTQRYQQAFAALKKEQWAHQIPRWTFAGWRSGRCADRAISRAPGACVWCSFASFI